LLFLASKLSQKLPCIQLPYVNFVPKFDNTNFNLPTPLWKINENPRNLRLRFTLCMQEFFDSIPQDQWRIEDPAFIKQSEEFAITKFKEWIIEQVT
jgi:hypothetical protein